MLIAVAKPEHLPEWLYPSRVPPYSGASLSAEYLDVGLRGYHLWSILGGATPHISRMVSSHCETGYSHDAIDQVAELAPEIIARLAGLTDHERYLVARDWATADLGRSPGDSRLGEYKDWLRELSAFARQAVANEWLVITVNP